MITLLLASLLLGPAFAEPTAVPSTTELFKKKYEAAKTFGGLLEVAKPLLTDEDISFLKSKLAPLNNTLPAAKFDKNSFTAHWGGKKIVLMIIDPLGGEFKINGTAVKLPLALSAETNFTEIAKILTPGHASFQLFPAAYAADTDTASALTTLAAYAIAAGHVITGKVELPRDIPKLQKECDDELATDYDGIGQTKGKFFVRQRAVLGPYNLLHAFVKEKCTTKEGDCASAVRALTCFNEARTKLRTHWRYNEAEAQPIPPLEDAVKGIK
jgi:hypothetical protein